MAWWTGSSMSFERTFGNGVRALMPASGVGDAARPAPSMPGTAEVAVPLPLPSVGPPEEPPLPARSGAMGDAASRPVSRLAAHTVETRRMTMG